MITMRFLFDGYLTGGTDRHCLSVSRISELIDM